LKIQTNVLENCFKYGIKKVVFLGSSCIYPKFAKQPMKEDCLITGLLEPTNSAYAVAKIAGIEMCKSYNKQYGTNYIAAMPTNLYGPRDNFDLNTSHVIPALIRKFHEAKENNTDVVLWGDGNPKREFLHVEDLADALIFLAENYNATADDCLINVGFGEDIHIGILAHMIKNNVVFCGGKTIWDKSKPNGTPKKLLDTTKINKLGWKPQIKLLEGLRNTYEWYVNNKT
jgi:GDP-L-fucose synthase